MIYGLTMVCIISKDAKCDVLVEEESPLQRLPSLIDILPELLTDCEPRNRPGRSLVAAASFNDGSFGAHHSKGVLSSSENNLAGNWFLSGTHTNLVGFHVSVTSTKSRS